MAQKKTALEPALTVYFDGLCHLCSREIDHYRKQSGSDKISFKDITAEDFDAQSEGVDPQQVHKVMHVKDSSGNLHTGVQAFIEIWKQLPKYSPAARLAQNPPVYAILNIGYQIFARIRPFLPRKAKDCSASPYCEIKEAP
jgi:predicted DCC family thiol-disulfide oxidoreductase YuxK